MPTEPDPKSGNANLFPSTAHIGTHGEYVHDPLNQPLAEAEAQGKTGAQPFANRQHLTAVKGYCDHGKLGGMAT